MLFVRARFIFALVFAIAGLNSSLLAATAKEDCQFFLTHVIAKVTSRSEHASHLQTIANPGEFVRIAPLDPNQKEIVFQPDLNATLERFTNRAQQETLNYYPENVKEIAITLGTFRAGFSGDSLAAFGQAFRPITKAGLAVVLNIADFRSVSDEGIQKIFHFAAVLDPKQYKVELVRSGNKSDLLKTFERINDFPLHFARGEAVRYRDSNDGLMATGVLLKVAGDRFEVMDRKTRQTISVPSNAVFKNISDISSVATPNWDLSHYNKMHRISPHLPMDLYRVFLNVAAHLESLPEFSDLSSQEKLSILAVFLGRIIPAAGQDHAIIELSGICSYSKVLESGIGVCRHNSTLLATIFREAGWPARIVTSLPNSNKLGHAWVELEMLAESGTPETYIVDPSAETAVFPYSERTSKKMDFYYSDPNRYEPREKPWDLKK